MRKSAVVLSTLLLSSASVLGEGPVPDWVKVTDKAGWPSRYSAAPSPACMPPESRSYLAQGQYRRLRSQRPGLRRPPDPVQR